MGSPRTQAGNVGGSNRVAAWAVAHACWYWAAPHFRAHAIERRVERKYKTYLLTADEQAVIREVLLACAHASTAEARKEADRHERRVRELISHQHKLLDLYYEDGVSKEVLQDQQKRLEAEQSRAQQLADAARFEISELDQGLSDALLLIDQRRVPYLTGSSTEKRLINLATYLMLLVSASGDVKIKPTPLYAELVPLARKLAREAGETRPQPRFSGPRFETKANGGEGGIRTRDGV